MKLYKIFLGLLISLICFSCQNSPKAKKLFVIGIDGTSSKCFQKAEMPFIQDFLKESSYSLKKRSVLPSSSAINWATMFMSATPETHGYTEWGSQTPEIPSFILGDNNIFPTVFQLFRKANPDAEMGCIYDWIGIKYLVDTASFNYHEKTPSMEPEVLADMAKKYVLEKKPDCGVFIFDNPDHMGHAFGWDSLQYHQMLTKLDTSIKTIIDAIKEAGLYDESLIVIISDHGGINRGHGGKTFDEIEAPAIFEGKCIKQGYCFDGDYCMHQYDVGATIAEVFALQLPQACCGKPASVIFK